MTPLTSMIRVHDLKDNMKLVGSYDFPEESPLRRYQPQPQSSAMISNETAHLHKLGDKAVGLCRTPKLALFVFKLPDGQLLKQVILRIGYLIIRWTFSNDTIEKCSTMFAIKKKIWGPQTGCLKYNISFLFRICSFMDQWKTCIHDRGQRVQGLQSSNFNSGFSYFFRLTCMIIW